MLQWYNSKGCKNCILYYISNNEKRGSEVRRNYSIVTIEPAALVLVTDHSPSPNLLTILSVLNVNIYEDRAHLYLLAAHN